MSNPFDLTPEQELELVLRTAIPKLPETVGSLMLQDKEVLRALRFPTGVNISVMDQRFDRGELLTALRQLANGSIPSLSSVDRQLTIADWEIADDGAAVGRSNRQAVRFPHVLLLSVDEQARGRVLANIASQGKLPREREEAWRTAVAGGPLEDTAFLAFEAELDEAPDAVLRSIHEQVTDKSAELADLVPLEEGYYRQLLGVYPAPPTLAEFKMAWLKMTAKQKRPRIATLIEESAALAIVDAALIPRAASRLSARGRAKVVRQLAGYEDPFASLAAFQICCAHRQENELETIGAGLAEALFNPECMRVSGDDFSTAFVLTEAILGRHRILADWPAYGKRLARTLHASRLVRLLAESNVMRPTFGELVVNAYGVQARLVELFEGREAPFFQAQFLGPGYVHGIVVSTASASISAIPDPERPQTWVTAGSTGMSKTQESPEAIFLFAPAPMDEFDTQWSGLTLVAPENVDRFLDPLVPGEDPAFGLSQLFKLVVGFDLGSADQNRLADAVPPFLEGLAKGDLVNAAEFGLLLAARWRNTTMSDAIMDIFFKKHGEGPLADRTAIPRLILVAADAVEPKEKWLKRAAAVSMRFAFSVRDEVETVNFVRGSDILGELDPELGSAIANARSFGLLGYDRLPRPPRMPPAGEKEPDGELK